MLFHERDLLYIYDPRYVSGTPGIAAQAQLAKSTMVTGGPMSTHSTAHMSMPYVFKALNDLPIDIPILCFGLAMETYDPTQPISFLTTVAIQQTNTIFNRSPWSFNTLDYVMWELPDEKIEPFGADSETGNQYVPVLVPLKRRLAKMVGDTMLAEQVRVAILMIQKLANDEDLKQKQHQQRQRQSQQQPDNQTQTRAANIMDVVLQEAVDSQMEGTFTYTWLKQLKSGELSQTLKIDSSNLVQYFAQDGFDMAMEANTHEDVSERYVRWIFLKNYINRQLLDPALKARIDENTSYDTLTALLDCVLLEYGIMFNARLIENIRNHTVGMCLSDTKSLEWLDIYVKPGMMASTLPI